MEEEDRNTAAIVVVPGKPHINVVFIGHVDHGKSTMSGAILLACGMIDKREIQKLQSDAAEAGRDSWWKVSVVLFPPCCVL